MSERTSDRQDDEPDRQPEVSDPSGSSVDQAKEREAEMEESGDENAG
jgi:hypothetical protein